MILTQRQIEVISVLLNEVGSDPFTLQEMNASRIHVLPMVKRSELTDENGLPKLIDGFPAEHGIPPIQTEEIQEILQTLNTN